MNRRRHRKSIIGLLLILLTFAVYYRLSGYEFVNYDDDLYVTANAQVQKGLTLKNLVWAFSTTDIANWHPLTWISHQLDVRLWGMDSGRHHLTSVLFHIANGLILFLALNQMTGALWRSAAVAALFALHPINVESVAWVAERKNVLSTFFWVLTMWSYSRYTENPARRRYLMVLFFFMLGLMAKPMLVTLPFVLLLLDYWPLKRFQFESALMTRPLNIHADIKTTGTVELLQSNIPSGPNAVSRNITILFLIREKIPLFVLSAVSCWVSFLAQQGAGAVRSMEAIPLTSRVANALVSYVAYMGKMILPFKLAVFYPYPTAIPGWKVAGAGVILILVFGLAWKIRKRYPYVLVGWLWYMGTLVPVIGFVQVGAQAMADRYAYVPLIGLFIAIVWGIAELADGWPYCRKPISVASIMMVGILCATTWTQLGCWKNSVELFRHALEVTAGNAVAHNNLGNALSSLDENDEAYKHYAEALRIQPHFANAHYNMARILTDRGELDEALGHYEAAIKSNPRLIKAYYNRGIILAQKGNDSAAIRDFSRALRLDPSFAEAHNNLGVVLIRQGKVNEAVSHFSRAVKLKSSYPAARQNLQRALDDMRSFD
jgi:tetratricopeptide (TPR) repeat protein